MKRRFGALRWVALPVGIGLGYAAIQYQRMQDHRKMEMGIQLPPWPTWRVCLHFVLSKYYVNRLRYTHHCHYDFRRDVSANYSTHIFHHLFDQQCWAGM